MTDKLDPVRERLVAAEDIDLDDVPSREDAVGATDDGDPGAMPGDYDGPPCPPHDDQGALPPLAQAALQPLNDYGNGQRLIIHFGEDLMFVPRVGWFTWSGRHWAKDDDTLSVRAKAQMIHRLIEAEADHIQPSDREKTLLDEGYALRRRQRELDDIGALDEDLRTEHQRNDLRLEVIAKKLTAWNKKIGQRHTFAKSAGNSGPITHMMEESQTDLAIPFEALDASPVEVNTAGGLLRFSVDAPVEKPTAKLATVVEVPHDRAQRQSKLIDVHYRPYAAAPTWDAFLERIQPDR